MVEAPIFFHSCNGGYAGVPSNWQGYQVPHTGNAYAGIIVYGELDGYREYIGIELTEPTIINQTYHICF